MKVLILLLVTFMVYNDVAMENLIIQVQQDINLGCNNCDIEEDNPATTTTTTPGPTTPESTTPEPTTSEPTTPESTTAEPTTTVDPCEGFEIILPGTSEIVDDSGNYEFSFYNIDKPGNGVSCSLDRPLNDMTKLRMDMVCYGYTELAWINLANVGGSWQWASGDAVEGAVDDSAGGSCSLINLGSGQFNYVTYRCDTVAMYPYLCDVEL